LGTAKSGADSNPSLKSTRSEGSGEDDNPVAAFVDVRIVSGEPVRIESTSIISGEL
jgi:hypothetical protein